MKLGIVVSETYWDEITSKMLELAEKTAAGHEVSILKVPGSFDIPLAVKRLLSSVDGVVTLGAVIQGETDHDGMISYCVGKALIDLSLEFNKPVVCGINGPKMTKAQAVARISRAEKVTKACLQLLDS
ncbi:MAG: 6,7-dimethyl-8-ribityllumazine synthase [Nanoarchaeota archaeon]|nr:6,7-dimethyl-8-ribityllumazine synthase [Nanoarchaeota archaeon]MBU1622762.1 6,7-dimethyl-8-ribityllumazine synthase [Nanoarchaeota archaeon]MBU1973922.1 6,7-dimethyl-8-ribityllumazine synthase [Nanoarchaeota archaeon]